MGETDEIPAVLTRPLTELGLEAQGVWAAEHVYRSSIAGSARCQLIPVFAARIAGEAEPTLSWEHSEFAWSTASECQERLTFRGLLEGLEWTRRFVSEVHEPAAELRVL